MADDPPSPLVKADKLLPPSAEFRKRRDANMAAVEETWKFPDPGAAANRDAKVAESNRKAGLADGHEEGHEEGLVEGRKKTRREQTDAARDALTAETGKRYDAVAAEAKALDLRLADSDKFCESVRNGVRKRLGEPLSDSAIKRAVRWLRAKKL